MKRATLASLSMFIFAILFTQNIYGSQRGVIVKARKVNGSIDEIQLYSDYFALVIGCGNYDRDWPDLPNPVNDARQVANMLEKLGWAVKLVENPKGAELMRSLNEVIVGHGRQKEKAILIWYSGHGYTLGEAGGMKLGYLVPVDAPDPNIDELDFMEKAVSMRQIETIARRIKSKHVLMLFDSCFSGAIFQTVRSIPSPYIEEKIRKPVRQFITAGTEDEQVPDQSVFKTVFLQGINEGYADRNQDGYVTGLEIGDYLQEQVVNYSRGAQHPQFGKINDPHLDKGDFVFHLGYIQIAEATRDIEAEKKRLTEEKLKIARERQELEKLRLEIERRKLEKERGRIESERQTLETSSLPPETTKKPPPSEFKEIDRYGRYIRYANGILYDTEAGLEWVSGPENYMFWDDANEWVESVSIGGGGWRIPTIDELKTLYKNKGAILRLTTSFNIKNGTFWSGDTLQSYYAYTINLENGSTKYCETPRSVGSSCSMNRVMAVRSRIHDGSTNQQEEKVASISTHNESVQNDNSKYKKSVDTQAQLANISKRIKFPKVTLRDTPRHLKWDSIERMIESNNFFEKSLNENGDFQNHFVDNGDGTISDLRTGLMWKKSSSGSMRDFWEAKNYLTSLNQEEFAGYDDWRVPTLEELCSILNRTPNEKGLYTGSGLETTNAIELASDQAIDGYVYAEYCRYHHFVNFKEARIGETPTNFEVNNCLFDAKKFSIRAVRTLMDK